MHKNRQERRRFVHTSGELAFVLLLAAVFVGLESVASATPATYTFTTGPSITNPIGTSPFDAVSLGVVSGTFTYDPQGVMTCCVAGTEYFGFANLSGTVDAKHFSIPNGTIRICNDCLAPTANGPGATDGDTLALRGTPSPGMNGFQIDGYSLTSVRLFWTQGELGIGDFLNNENLPSVLPSFAGRLALDFGTQGSQSVFFDGLMVQAQSVTEPETYSVLGSGLALLVFLLACTKTRTGEVTKGNNSSK